jgi:hypothetical protein
MTPMIRQLSKSDSVFKNAINAAFSLRKSRLEFMFRNDAMVEALQRWALPVARLVLG